MLLWCILGTSGRALSAHMSIWCGFVPKYPRGRKPGLPEWQDWYKSKRTSKILFFFCNYVISEIPTIWHSLKLLHCMLWGINTAPGQHSRVTKFSIDYPRISFYLIWSWRFFLCVKYTFSILGTLFYFQSWPVLVIHNILHPLGNCLHKIPLLTVPISTHSFTHTFFFFFLHLWNSFLQVDMKGYSFNSPFPTGR